MLRRSWRVMCAAAGCGSGRPPMPPHLQQQMDAEAAAGTPAAAAASSAATGASPAADDSGEDVPKRRFRIRTQSTVNERAIEKGSMAFFSGFVTVGLISLGCAFLFVPIFRLYCQPTGHGADPKFVAKGLNSGNDDEELSVEEKMGKAKRKKLLTVRFLSDVGNTMPIAFVPLQRSVEMLIGEPSLAFYSAYNKSNRTLLGVSTYTISPPEATPYLNKIQCFCFEEQRFKPHELVEMPVFFYIDKDFLADPMLNWLDEVILNYTFFNLDRTRDIIAQF